MRLPFHEEGLVQEGLGRVPNFTKTYSTRPIPIQAQTANLPTITTKTKGHIRIIAMSGIRIRLMSIVLAQEVEIFLLPDILRRISAPASSQHLQSLIHTVIRTRLHLHRPFPQKRRGVMTSDPSIGKGQRSQVGNLSLVSEVSCQSILELALSTRLLCCFRCALMS